MNTDEDIVGKCEYLKGLADELNNFVLFIFSHLRNTKLIALTSLSGIIILGRYINRFYITNWKSIRSRSAYKVIDNLDFRKD